ncbi:YggN family protein [Metallibacterium sp.]
MHLQRRVARFALIGLLTLALSACGGGASINMHGQTIHMHGDRISIRDRGGDTAEIAANGDLRIAGKPVLLTPAQRVLTTRYFTQAQIAMFYGKQTGLAGAHMAGSIVGSLFSALFHDDSRIINDTAHAQTVNLDRHVDRLCAEIGTIRATQDQLVARLPAFAPYAAIDQRSVKSCFVNAHASNS